jgi:chorismate mutase
MKAISDWRADIDHIDSEILRLLSRRVEIAIEVGKLKRTSGAPLHSAERENFVLTRVIQENSGPLNMRSIQQIFRLIIRETRRAEQCVAADVAPGASPDSIEETCMPEGARK